MKDFVFLICTERSGSNFITSLMNGHSRISGPPPSHLFRLFGTNRANYGNLESERNWRTLLEDFVVAFECKLGSWSTGVTAEELHEGVGERSVAAILRFLYEKEADQDGADVLFVKENHTYSFAPFLLAHFPGCRFVWMVRDPRDVASSWVSTRSIPGGVAKAIDIWLDDQAAARALHQQLREVERIVRVRYEELVGEPVPTLHRLTEFLGLRYEEAILDFHGQPRTRENASRIDAWANLDRPVLRDNTGKYRNVLTRDDVRYVELACHGLMADFGYACDLVTQPPDPQALSDELEALRPSVSPGGYEIPTDEEEAIRSRRLASIEQVLARKL